ncbi:MAG: hypothetical protein NZZ41_02275 [Candidatus Dojkabacteria bacterium]|nr:hypothetical protein [Candidatus Dojkabacteria bacterium]
MGKKYIFDGEDWNKLSPRYQTRRRQEKIKKEVEQKRKLEEYKAILENPENYDQEFLRLTELRYKTLLRNVKVNKEPEEDNELRIPLRIDQRTVIFVRERDIFKAKYVNRFGLEWLRLRVERYKALLPYKPESIVYWNPF